MAVSISNHSFFAVTRPSAFSSSSCKPSRTSLVFHSVHCSHRPPLARPVLGLSYFSNGYNSCSYRTRPSFKSSFSVDFSFHLMLFFIAFDFITICRSFGLLNIVTGFSLSSKNWFYQLFSLNRNILCPNFKIEVFLFK